MNSGNTGRYSAVLREERPALPPSVPPRVESAEIPVSLSHGKWRLTLAPAAALMLLCCGLCFAASYFYARSAQPEDTRQLERDVRDQMSAQRQAMSDLQNAVNQRLSGIETQMSLVKVSQDTLRDRVNDRLAHP